MKHAIIGLLTTCILLSGAQTMLLADGNILVVGEMTREAKAGPGDKAEGKLILRNNGDKPQDVKVYQTDYHFTAAGNNTYGEPGKLPRSNAAWFDFTPKQLTVPAQGTATVYYTAQVPKDDTLKGTYWSMLMVEPLAVDSPESTGTDHNKVKVGVRTVTRYGIQFVTNIGEAAKADIRFLDRQLVARDKRILLQADVENTGERWLSPTVWIELYDKDGATVGRFSSSRQRVFPGCSARFTIDLTDVPKGKYNALTVADNGDDNVFGTQAEVEIK